MYEKSLDRRAFLALGGAGAIAAAGATTCLAHASEQADVAVTSEGGMPGTASLDEDWRQMPEAVPEEQIGETYEHDFVVIGMGHAGTSCARTLAEAGADVVAIEAQDEETFSAYGEDFGHIGSQWQPTRSSSSTTGC